MENLTNSLKLMFMKNLIYRKFTEIRKQLNKVKIGQR